MILNFLWNRFQEYQNDSLKKFFEENALMFPIETIIGTYHYYSLIIILPIEKTRVKDYQFFLSQRNFLKVVDTLQKFEEGALDKNSDQARDFIVFKRQLYKMYQI